VIDFTILYNIIKIISRINGQTNEKLRSYKWNKKSRIKYKWTPCTWTLP